MKTIPFKVYNKKTGKWQTELDKTSIKEQELDQEIKYLYNKILKKLEKYK